MGNQISGWATDSITRIDSVRLAIYDSVSGMWWNGTAFAATDTQWLAASGVPAASGDMVEGWDSTGWNYTFPDPFGADSFGMVRAFARCWDDLANQSDMVSHTFYIDNKGPILYPTYPVSGEAIYLTDWNNHDSIKVFCADTSGFGINDVDSVKFNIRNPDGYYWYQNPFGGGAWIDPPPGYSDSIWVHGTKTPGSDIWYYTNPFMTMTEGTYQVRVIAWDAAGNWTYIDWNFYIISHTGFLVIDTPTPRVHQVGETFPVTVTAYVTPGVVDTTFTYPVIFGSNMVPSDSVDLPDTSYLSRGTGTFYVTAHQPMSGFEVWTESPGSGLARAWTEPIEILALIDTSFDRLVRDVPLDQGNQLSLWHEAVALDPGLTLVAYHYYRDTNLSTAPGDTNWVEMPTGGFISYTDYGDSLVGVFDNLGGWDAYEYSMIVVVQSTSLPSVVDSSARLLVAPGPIAPTDDIPPAKVTGFVIAKSGSDMKLIWHEVRLGNDGVSAELDPSTNITYNLYRTTDPYTTTSSPLASKMGTRRCVDKCGTNSAGGSTSRRPSI